MVGPRGQVGQGRQDNSQIKNSTPCRGGSNSNHQRESQVGLPPNHQRGQTTSNHVYAKLFKKHKVFTSP